MTPDPIPQPILDELLCAVAVQFNPDGALANLRFPSERELTALLPLVGGPNISHSLDEVQAQLQRRAWQLLPQWRQRHMAPRPVVAPPRPLPPGVARFYAAPVETAPDHHGAALEARVRSMPYADLARLCAANGLTYKLEAPNQGVLVMRARNTIYNAIKAGKVIQGDC